MTTPHVPSKIRNSEDFKVIVNLIEKFQEIEEKNRCLRVRFLDWFSEKLEKWSKQTKELSNKIHSPCKIKI